MNTLSRNKTGPLKLIIIGEGLKRNMTGYCQASIVMFSDLPQQFPI